MIGDVELVARLGFAATLGSFTFLAPCAFPLLPGYLAFYLGAADDVDDATAGDRVRRSVGLAVLASAGFFVVFALLGGVVSLVGTSALANIGVLELAVGSLLVVLGVAMATGRRPQVHVALPERTRSPSGFFLFGVVYAVAAAGCTAPLFIGVVGAGLAAGPALGAATLVAYAAGMSAMMIGVTALAAVGRNQVLRRLSATTGRLERTAGVLLALAGVAQIGYYLFWLGGWATIT